MPAKIAFGENRQTPGHYVDVALLCTQSVSEEGDLWGFQPVSRLSRQRKRLRRRNGGGRGNRTRLASVIYRLQSL